MFALGLHFSIRQLAKVGLTSFVAAAAEIMLMTWIGYSIGSFFGWSKMNSIFLGAMLSISSTTIVVKTLNELHRSNAPFAKYITGILGGGGPARRHHSDHPQQYRYDRKRPCR